MAANLTNFKIIESLKNGEFVNDSQGMIIHLTKENESLKNDNEIFLSLVGSIGYKVSQNSDFDIILNLNFRTICPNLFQEVGRQEGLVRF